MLASSISSQHYAPNNTSAILQNGLIALSIVLKTRLEAIQSLQYSLDRFLNGSDLINVLNKSSPRRLRVIVHAWFALYHVEGTSPAF